MNRLISFIFSFFRKKDKKSYSFSSYTIPNYKLDLNGVGYGIIIPLKVSKPKRNFFGLFYKKPKYKVKITDNKDGSKNWEIIK
jgi:hypothetical protein